MARRPCCELYIKDAHATSMADVQMSFVILPGGFWNALRPFASFFWAGEERKDS
jgi:hypothetical protein